MHHGTPPVPGRPSPAAGAAGASLGGPPAYRVFPRAEWAELRANTPLSLSDEDIAGLRGLTEQLSLKEVADVFLPSPAC
ncbi:hypothetical protein [Teichococcus aestuarii]|uniref:hypothetical protein n=1 Tax=Teichococcus aestuarii TaxID=568898 RepID=UPI003607F409